VRELHPSEGVIRELKRKSDEPLPVQVSASGRRLGLFATESHGTRWTCLERAVSEPEPGEGEEKAVDWTIIQDRSTQVCADFGLGKEGPIASAAGQTLPFELSVRLVPNELEPQQNPILKVTARAESGRVWLHAADGLKLLPVSEPGGWNRVALVTGDSDATAKVFQGNGWVVEGFEITGLNQLAAFDAGSFLLAAPTKEEPPAGN
jgi:hypothetical protein